MIRKIIKIKEEKCNGCGACAAACHEGAIEIIDGKAKLTREDYCDGLGDCLPSCPMDAITFEEREAPAYNEAAVLAAKAQKEGSGETLACGTGCCATAVAGVLGGLTDTRVNVHVLGGVIACEWDQENNVVYMTGPAVTVFDGEVEL